MTEPTTAAGPSKVVRLRIEELRNLGVEDSWSDKFYAALAALWQVVKGTEIPAQGAAPHIVMARLIEDVAWAEARQQDGSVLRSALDTAYREADDFDSNHGRWVIQRLADRLGVEVAYPPVSEPNNRLREQLAECQSALAALPPSDAA